MRRHLERNPSSAPGRMATPARQQGGGASGPRTDGQRGDKAPPTRGSAPHRPGGQAERGAQPLRGAGAVHVERPARAADTLLRLRRGRRGGRPGEKLDPPRHRPRLCGERPAPLHPRGGLPQKRVERPELVEFPPRLGADAGAAAVPFGRRSRCPERGSAHARGAQGDLPGRRA